MPTAILLLALALLTLPFPATAFPCRDRFDQRSRLDELAQQQGDMYHLSADRARAVSYDRATHEGYIGNDQGSNYHDYLFTYERLFCGLPPDLTLVNIGILDGHSLRTCDSAPSNAPSTRAAMKCQP